MQNPKATPKAVKKKRTPNTWLFMNRSKPLSPQLFS
jgi:hypothetical protein